MFCVPPLYSTDEKRYHSVPAMWLSGRVVYIVYIILKAVKGTQILVIAKLQAKFDLQN